MKMKYSITFMVIGSFVIQYFVMSLLMTSKLQDIRNSLSKFYISAIMGLLMGILEVFMHDLSMMKISMKYYIPLIVLLIIFVVAYRIQFYILDKNYLREMIEHHSMAIFTSTEILNKTHNYEVTKLAKNIIETQNEEIKKMNDLLLSNKV
jgi:hypothetical protein